MNAPETRIRIVLADDHDIVRQGLRRLLGHDRHLEIVAEVDTGEAAMAQYAAARPDLLVMDLSMPGIGGLEAARRIIRSHDRARVLVYSVHENHAFVSRAMDVGVRGYVTKRSASREILPAVQRVATGGFYVSEDVLETMGAVDSGIEAAVQSLTDREFEVLRLVATGASVRQVAEVLHLTPKAVHYHDARMRRKLEITTPLELIRIAVHLGMVTV